jgi:hypothetical protein
MIKATVTLTGSEKTQAKILEFMNTEGIKTAAAVSRSIIIDRTRSGRDVDGKTMKPYTDAYAEEKARLGKDVSVVNMTLSGRGLDSMHLNEHKELTFSADAYPRMEGNARFRKYFGLNDKVDFPRITRAITSIWNGKFKQG